MTSEIPTRFGALSQPSYRWYSFGNFLSMTGLWLQRLAIGWLAWDLSKSETWVGLIAFAQFAPVFVFSIFFGVMADRVNNRHASVVINLAMALLAVVLAALTLTETMTVEYLFIVSLLFGVTTAANGPVRLSIVPALVPRALMPSAVAINSILFNSSRLLGPALASVIMATIGVGWTFAINAFSYLPLIFAVALVPMTPRPGKLRERFMIQIRAGLSYVQSHDMIRWQLWLTAWAALFGRAVLEMLPVFSDVSFDRGIAGLAWLTAGAGCGAIIAGLLIAQVSAASATLQKLTIYFNILAASGMLVLAWTSSFYIGILIVGVLGLAVTGAAVTSQSVVQVEVEDELRGRVNSLWMMAGLGGTAIGSLLLGLMSEIFGLGTAITISGFIALGLPLFVLLARKSSKTEIEPKLAD